MKGPLFRSGLLLSNPFLASLVRSGGELHTGEVEDVVTAIKGLQRQTKENKRDLLLFFDSILAQAPYDDGDPAFALLRCQLFRLQGVDPVLPVDIDIATKRENHSCWKC